MANASEVAQIKLAGVGGGPDGWAVLSARGNETEVVVRLAGAAGAAGIYAGFCGTPAGSGLAYGLSKVAGPNNTSVTTVALPISIIVNGGYSIGARSASDPSAFVSCGNLATSANTATIALGALGASGVRGFATLNALGADTEVVVQISRPVTGAEAQAIHILGGTCGANLGGVSWPLTNMTNNVSVTTLTGVNLVSILEGTYAVNIHRASDATQYVACGNLPTHANPPTSAEAANVVIVALDAQNNSGRSGWALLEGQGAQTKVTLRLLPGATATGAAHIRGGPCNTLGAVVHPLADIADRGLSVTTLNTSLSSLLTGGLAVNTHSKANAAVYTACGNIPAEMNTVTVKLAAQNRSGQNGFATLSTKGTSTNVVTLLSRGALTSGTAGVHSGPNCGANPGVLVRALANVTGGASVSTIDLPLSTIRVNKYVVNTVQQGGTTYTACAAVPSAPALADAANVVQFALGQEGDTGVTGWVQLIGQGASTKVTVYVTAGTAASENVRIHRGSCDFNISDSGNPGSVVFTLNNLAGNVSVTTINASLQSLLANGEHMVYVYQKDASTFNACGQIPAPNLTTTFALAGRNGSQQNGYATLTARGERTEVVVTLTNGAIESEAIHIYSGTCANLGKVVAPLTSLSEKAGLVTSVTTVDTPWGVFRTSPHVVNTHQKGAPATYTACGAIPAPPAAS